MARAMGERRTISCLDSVRAASNISRDNHERKNINSTLYPPSSSQSRRNSPPLRRNNVSKMLDYKTLEEAISSTHNRLRFLSPHQLAAFWTAVPDFLHKLGSNNKHHTGEHKKKQIQKLDEILIYTLKEIQRFSHRPLSQITLGFAKIVKHLGGHRRTLVEGSSHRQLHDYFIGEKSENKEFIFRKIAGASLHVLKESNAQSLSNFVYAYGLAEYDIEFEGDGEEREYFFDMLAGKVIFHLETCDARQLSNILWAYANVNASNPGIFNKAADMVIAKDLFKTFTSQDISHIVWAHATAQEQHHQLFREMSHHVVRLGDLNSFLPEALSNIVWAYATADECHPKLFKKVADHIVALPNLRSFKPRHLSDIVWAYSSAGENHSRLFRRVAGHIATLDTLDEFIPQQLSNIALAYTTANEAHALLFEKVADAVIKNQDGFTSQNVADLLQAYAIAGQIDQNLFTSLASTAAALVGECTSQNLANIAWAYAVSNVEAPSLFNDDFIQKCLEKENEFSIEHKSQLHQWNLWQEELQSNIRLPPSLGETCYQTFLSNAPTPMQDDIISELMAIGIQPKGETLTKNGYFLDALVEVDGNKIGIEINDSSHSAGGKATGSTILKHRQVANLEEISFVSVPYREWNKLGKDRSRKQQCLRKCFVKLELGFN